jgi:Uma2 family endonuclease
MSDSADEFDVYVPVPATERLSVDEYRRKAALGEFSVSKTFELLEGVVVPKARQTLRHETALENIQNVIGKLIPEGWHLRVQQPMACSDSQPEPDGAVVRNALDEYVNRPPQPSDVAMIIEVAEGSLKTDRQLKGRIYARAGITQYWVLDIIDNQLEVYTNASGPVQMPAYHEKRVYRVEDKLSLVIGLDDLGMVKVRDLLP